jgi:hypothetical protein
VVMLGIAVVVNWRWNVGRIRVVGWRIRL